MSNLVQKYAKEKRMKDEKRTSLGTDWWASFSKNS